MWSGNLQWLRAMVGNVRRTEWMFKNNLIKITHGLLKLVLFSSSSPSHHGKDLHRKHIRCTATWRMSRLKNFFYHSVSFLCFFGSLGDGCTNRIHFNRWFLLLQFRRSSISFISISISFFIRLSDDFKEKKEDTIFHWLGSRSAKCKTVAVFICLFIQKRRIHSIIQELKWISDEDYTRLHCEYIA